MRNTGSSSPIGTQSPRARPSATAVPLTSAPGHVVLGTTGKVIQPTATVSSTPVPAPSKSCFLRYWQSRANIYLPISY